MSLRGRVTVATAAVVALAVVVISLASYFALRSALVSDVDDRLRGQQIAIERAGPLFDEAAQGAFRPRRELRDQVLEQNRTDQPGQLDQQPGEAPRPQGTPAPGGPIAFAQSIDEDGTVKRSFGPLTIPVTSEDRLIAAGTRADSLTDRELEGVRVRVLTFHRATGGAAQVAQPLTDVDNALSSLVGLLVFISAGGVALAALAAWLVSARVVEPITELEGAADRIERTGDLDERVVVKTTDEVGRLAERFNAMLDRLRGSQQALESSLEAQRQFVADASHELRTPVTSIRTNAELLAENPEIDPQERTAMASDIADQAAEMTAMMTALIELARGDTGLDQAGTVKFADVVRREVDRLRAQHPGIEFDMRLDEAQIAAHPGLVGRVVGNLLDNAAKFSPAGGTVTVAQSGGTLTISDQGPGIAAEDLPHVFDRFYRGGRARALPGSGLGLAIVKQVVDAHGGTIEISSPPGAGTTVTLRMPAPPSGMTGGADSGL